MALDLTSLTLTVSDNLDGTVNWSAAGAGAAADLTLFQAPWNKAAGGRMAWTAFDTATADGAGNATRTLRPAGGYGFYVWLLARMATASAANAIGSAVFRPVVDPANPIHNRVLDAMVALIQSLNMDGIGSGGKVFKRWFPRFLPGTDDRLAATTPTATAAGPGLPLCIVSPFPKELPLGLLTNRDDVGYPVLIGFWDVVNATLDQNMRRNLKWRRQVAALFRNQQLAGVPEVVLCDWQPDLVVSNQALDQNQWIGAMGFTFRSRETRGLIA